MIKITNEQDWHKYRAKGIGGSDAACVLGLNSWKSNVDLWKEKTGRKKPEDISNKEAVIYGKRAEEYIRGLFELDYPEYKVEYAPFDLQQNNEHPFIIGTLDAILTHFNTPLECIDDVQIGFAEFKTTEIRKSTDWEKWNNKVPDNYYCQIGHYFATNPNFKFAILRALLKSTDKNGNKISTIKDYYFKREDMQEDIDFLISREVDFWNNYVLKDIEPPLKLPSL